MTRERVTCPTCGQHWPDGKDPASKGDIYALRIADLLAGLVEANTILAPHFHVPEQCGPEVAVGRWIDLRDAVAHIERAMELLSGCAVMRGLAGWIADNGYPYPDPDGMGTVTRAQCGPHTLQVKDGEITIVEDET